MRFNNPLQLAWQLHALDAIMLISAAFILVYSIRQYRCGRPTYLVLYVTTLISGVIIELTTGMWLTRSYIQGEFTVMIATKEYLGYPTDMPLYVMVAYYPQIVFVAFKVIEAFAIRSILVRALSMGIVMMLIDAAYEVNGILPNMKWWRWIDWHVAGRDIFQYWYGWPLAEAGFLLTWPGFMAFLIWHWEKRNAVGSAAGTARVKSQPWKTLLAAPLAMGILMNTVGVLVCFSLGVGIAIAFNLPHYAVLLIIASALAAVFLFSAKRPVALDGAGWTLVAIQVLGFGGVTLTNFAERPVPGGHIAIAMIACAALAILAYYPGYVARHPHSELNAVADLNADVEARQPASAAGPVELLKEASR